VKLIKEAGKIIDNERIALKKKERALVLLDKEIIERLRKELTAVKKQRN